MDSLQWEVSSFNAGVSFLCSIFATYLLIAYRLQELNRQRREIFSVFCVNIIAWSTLTLFAQTPILPGNKLLIFQIAAIFWLQSGYMILRLFGAFAGVRIHPAWTLLSITGVIAAIAAPYTGHFIVSIEQAWFGFKSLKGFLYPVFIFLFIIPPIQAAIHLLFKELGHTEGDTNYNIRSILIVSIIVLVASLISDVLLPEFGLILFNNSFMIANIIIAYSYYRASKSLKTLAFGLEKAAATLFEGLEDGMILIDLDGRIQQCNSSAAKLLGSSPSKLRGDNILKHLPELEIGFLHHAIPITLNQFGIVRHLSVSTTLHKDRGIPYGSVLVLRDQSELVSIQQQNGSTGSHPLAESTLALRQAEKAIREQENYLRALLDNIPFEIWAKNTEGIFIMQNRFDVENRGRQVGLIWKADPSNPREVQQQKEEEKALRGDVSRSEFSLLRKGRTHWFQNMIVPIHVQSTIIGIISITMDMTELKTAEQDRVNFKERLMHANKMEAMGTLAGGIAHDFNNLLGSLTGYCELAMESLPAGTSTANYLQEALRSADNARHLVRQILSFTRDNERDAKPTSLRFVIQESLAFLRSSIPQGIKLEMNLSESELTIIADSSELHRVLVNLVTNSIQAMGKTGGILSVRTRAVQVNENQPLSAAKDIPYGNYALIEVADTGHGIAPDKLDRIFDPFFTTKGPQEGSGLGLPIVQGILEANQALIRVESEPGMGTCFSIYWPLKTMPNPMLEPEGAASRVILIAKEPLRQQILDACANIKAEWIFPPSINDLPRLWSIQRWRAAFIDYSLLVRPLSEWTDVWKSQGIQATCCIVAPGENTPHESMGLPTFTTPVECRDFLNKLFSDNEDH